MLYTHSPVKANKHSCWTDKKHLTKLWSTAGFLSLPHMYQCKQSGNFPSLLNLSPKCNISQPMYFFKFFNDSINQHTLSTSPEVSWSPKPPFSPWKTFVISNLFQLEASISIYQHLPTCTCRLIISWHQEEYLVLHWLLSRFLRRNSTVCKRCKFNNGSYEETRGQRLSKRFICSNQFMGSRGAKKIYWDIQSWQIVSLPKYYCSKWWPFLNRIIL